MAHGGALFSEWQANVAYGDKVIGTDRTLPTGKAARYAGRLRAGEFFWTCISQRVPIDEASATIGICCSRLCALEGFAGHGEQAASAFAGMAGRTVPSQALANRSPRHVVNTGD